MKTYLLAVRTNNVNGYIQSDAVHIKGNHAMGNFQFGSSFHFWVLTANSIGNFHGMAPLYLDLINVTPKIGSKRKVDFF